MKSNPIYEERVTSTWTEALFSFFTILFFSLLLWRMGKGKQDVISIAFLCLFIFFLFYTLNYRVLIIRISSSFLKLRFGIFTWTVPLDNVADFQLDHLPILMWYGGAGIHFMLIRGRYRVSFNFLEHPRVVIALHKKAGLVQDVSFSTRLPNEVLKSIQEAIAKNRAPDTLFETKPRTN